jgi:ABC-type phosphate transport system permease subunit
MLSAFSFTFANGYLQGLANLESNEVSSFVQFIGVIIFFIGMAINIYSDRILQQTKEKLNK